MAGYSPTPLVKKLGIKPGFRMELVNVPDHYFDLIEQLPEDIEVLENGNELDFVHAFTNKKKELSSIIDNYKDRIVPTGMIWVSWYKKASKLPSEISEDDVRKEALNSGLVDVKVCAVDSDWSGLKLMIRIKDRK